MPEPRRFRNGNDVFRLLPCVPTVREHCVWPVVDGPHCITLRIAASSCYTRGNACSRHRLRRRIHRLRRGGAGRSRLPSSSAAAERFAYRRATRLELRLKKICEGLTEIIAAAFARAGRHRRRLLRRQREVGAQAGTRSRRGHAGAAQAGLEVVAYSPLSIKSAVVGYGRAEKSQVQIMVARLLDLPAPPAACRRRRRARHRHLSSAYRRNPAASTSRFPLIESPIRMNRWCLLFAFLPALWLLGADSLRQLPRRLSGAGFRPLQLRLDAGLSLAVVFHHRSVRRQEPLRRHPAPDETNDTDAYQQDFTMSDANRQKIFELAQKLHYFQGDYDSHHQAHGADRQEDSAISVTAGEWFVHLQLFAKPRRAAADEPVFRNCDDHRLRAQARLPISLSTSWAWTSV